MRDAVCILVAGCAVGAIVARAIDPHLSPPRTAAVVLVSLLVVASPLFWIRIAKPIVRAVNRERRRVAQRDAEQALISARQEFDARLARALDMADNEEDVLEVVRRALAEQVHDSRSEFLLADSSRAHLARVAVGTPDGEPAGCTVDSPQRCPAVRRGQTTTFASDDALDACPRLAGRPYGACSAACVPVTIMGRAVGVLHVTSAPQTIRRVEDVHALETLARLAGARVGLLRAMHKTSLQAATDPLTGLANRRTLEDIVRDLFERGEAFALAIADVDHFKVLNDTHGHEVGDRALRLFARTMRDAVRPDDVVARYGGEEFVLLLRGATVVDAVRALERIRNRLAERLAGGSTPEYTASFGIAHSSLADRFDELFTLADRALLAAKRAGRDRIAIGGDEIVTDAEVAALLAAAAESQ